MAETQDWFAANAPPAAPPKAPDAKGRDFKILGVNIHVPAPEPPRADSNIATVGSVGVAPEDALMAGQAGRAIMSSAKSGGALAGVVEAAKQATPLVKYEASKTAFRAMGIPEPFAVVLAGVVSGYKKGAKPAAAEAEAAATAHTATPPPAATATPTATATPDTPAARLQEAYQQALARGKAAVTSPVESAPGGRPLPSGPPPAATPVSSTVIPGQPPTPQLVPNGTAVPPATAEYYPQKFLNEVAIQAKRQKVTLGDADYAIASKMTAQGATPQQAVQTIAQARTAPPSAPAGPAKPHLAAAEAGAYLNLRKAGKSHQEAMEALQAMRTMATGLPSSADVAASVAARNQTGRWPE